MSFTYRFKKRPYHHQVAGIKKLLANGYGGALLCEPRTGKTKIAIDYLSILHQGGKVNRVLVICPVGVMGVWEDQLKENCPFPYTTMQWDKDKRKKKIPLPKFGKDRLDIVITNYEAFSTPASIKSKDEYGAIVRHKNRGGRYDAINAVKAWQPQLIILDESHRIKSPSSRKTRAIWALGPVADYRLILTGTVVTKSKRLFDIYAQWKFLNPQRFSNMTFGEFKNTYGRWLVMDKYSKWLGNRHEHELHKLIHLDAFSITREECYDLPKSTNQIIPVQLEESAEYYDRMAEDMVVRIHTGEITEASIRLVQGMRLQQITSGLLRTSPSDEYPNGRLVIGGHEKLRAIQSRIEDLMEMDEKVVIGAVFKADIARLKEMCEKLKLPVFVISGGMSHQEREYARTQFPKVKGGAVFIGQPAAAGEGIDLSCASIMQWYSLPLSWVNFRQFSDRIALSSKPTFHEFFLAPGIDQVIYETLQEDGDVGKMMIQSPERLLRLQEGNH